MINLGVFISGNGTNLQAIIDAIEEGLLDANITLVVSSNPIAYGLERAKIAGIPTLVLVKKDYDDPIAADERIVRALQDAQVDYVILAGYMRLARKPLLDAFPSRIVNIHPSLLPAFKGGHAIGDAFAAGARETGVTIHFANEAYDKGPVIIQQAVTVDEEDSLESLELKIHKVEHELYPKVLQLLAEDRVRVGEDGKVHILHNPEQ